MDNSKVIKTEAPPPGNLGLVELYALSIGQVIGAGVITLVGPAIAATGLSAWLAYFLAIVMGFFVILPVVFVTSTIRMSGGYYSLISAMTSEKVAGMFAISQLTGMIGLSLFGVSLGLYINSVFPSVNPTLCGVLLLTFFYVVNLLGIDFMASAQKIMTWILIAALLLFIVVGFRNYNYPVLDVNGPDFMTNGVSGLLKATFLFVYSTTGYSMTMNYGASAKNAKKDIPIAILLSVPTIMILYCGVAIAGSSVLPIEVVSGQTLTLVAKHILNGPLFAVFIIGGPIMALATTMNSSMPANAMPIQKSCEDGWFPKSFGALNKRGAPWKILTLNYVMGLLPLLLGFNVSTITNNIMLLNSLKSILYIYAYYKLPTKFPEAWAKSKFHVPNGVYYVLVTICLFCQLAILYNSARALTPTVAIVSIVATAACIIFGLVRSKSPDISIKANVWAD